MEEGDLRWCCGSSSSNDWDLHAVVRSATSNGNCSGGSRGVVSSPRASDESLFSGSGVPLPPPPHLQHPIGGPAVDDFWANDRSVPRPRNEEAPPPQQPPAPKPRTSYRNNDGAGGGGPTRSKRKKKKKSQVSNKEVTRVRVGASSPDPWAWRKYGQKTIKGSPYPRGYYRCSTDKDCRARKQVERCRTDPSTLIVRYTGGEHSHPVPLHRNALAGTTRNRPQRQPASSSASPAEQRPAASSSRIDTSTTPPHCPFVGVKYEEDDAVAEADSMLLEDAEMKGEEDAMSFLKPTPPSPTNDGSGSWAAPAAMNEMYPF